MLFLILRKKRIIAFTKTVWPEEQPAPWFGGNTENTKKLLEIVEQLGQDEAYTFSKGGLPGAKAIEEIIRKHMQERRRKENDPLLSELGEGSASDSNSSGSVTPKSQQQAKIKSYEAYFIDGNVCSLLCISVDFRYLSQMSLTWSQLTINVFYELHVFMWVVHFHGQKLLWHAFDTKYHPVPS